MAVEWIDSCQVLATPAQRGYGSTGSIGVYSGGYLRGANGGGNTNTYRDVTANATYTLNCRFYETNVGSNGSSEVFLFNDAGTRHFDVRVNTAGAIFVTRNGTTLETGAAGAIVSSVPRWISIRVTISDTGSYEIWLDGVLYINNGGASADTRNAGTAQVSRIIMGSIASSVSSQSWQKDIIMCSGNQIIADSQVEALIPSGAGNSTEWTPLSSTNVSNVDEATPDDDTSYNIDNVSGHKDTFALGNLGLSASQVIATQEVTRVRKDAAGALSVRQLVRTGGTDYDNGSDIALSTSYTYAVKVREVSPNGGAAWTEAEINGLESGYKIA